MVARKPEVDWGYSHGYVRCACGSRHVSLFNVTRPAIYSNGRRVAEARVVGVRCKCLDCGATQAYVPEPPVRS